MNRVLNKDFVSGSYLNSALESFSDVFLSASCMQSCTMRSSKRVNLSLILDYSVSRIQVCFPGQGIDEEW